MKWGRWEKKVSRDTIYTGSNHYLFIGITYSTGSNVLYAVLYEVNCLYRG